MRFRDAEWAEIEAAASLYGVPPSTALRHLALHAAREELAEAARRDADVDGR